MCGALEKEVLLTTDVRRLAGRVEGVQVILSKTGKKKGTVEESPVKNDAN